MPTPINSNSDIFVFEDDRELISPSEAQKLFEKINLDDLDEKLKGLFERVKNGESIERNSLIDAISSSLVSNENLEDLTEFMDEFELELQ